jgi:hypothetical protein
LSEFHFNPLFEAVKNSLMLKLAFQVLSQICALFSILCSLMECKMLFWRKRFFQGSFYLLLPISIPLSQSAPISARRLVVTTKTTQKIHSIEKGLKDFHSTYKNSCSNKQYSTNRNLFCSIH